jgi:integrase
VSVVYSRSGVPVETRFDPGTPLSKLIRWRKRQLGLLADTEGPPARGSLARAIVTYLKRVKGRPSYRSEKAHLRAWLKTVGNVKRSLLTPQKAAEAIATGNDQRGPQTIHHRCRLLAAMFHAIDGPRSPTPVDDLTLPAKPKPRPVSVSDETINAVAAKLKEQEEKHRLHDAKTRARFLVLAAHAQRPSEMKRTQPEDVDLERRLWFVRGAKGGYSVIVPLNADQVQAWQFFIQADAWGHYDTRSFARVLRTAGWPKAIRPYNLRHSTGFAL